MPITSRICVAFSIFILTLSATLAAAADIKPAKIWKGSVADEGLLKDAPTCVVSAKGFEKLWADWKLKDKPPEVDFDKFLLVVQTTGGSLLNPILKLDDKGDLSVLGMATFDLVPGFRYVISSIPKDGIKTIMGKPLPK